MEQIAASLGVHRTEWWGFYALPDVPDWVPHAVAEIIPWASVRTEEQHAIRERLATDPRMRRVWTSLLSIEPTNMSRDDVLRRTFSHAFCLACERRPATIKREFEERTRAAGGYWPYYLSEKSLGESVVMVAHKPDDDPVVKAVQQSLVAWFMSHCSGPHLALAQTLTEVALDCKSTRMAGRLPHKPPPTKPQRAAGCC